MENIKIGLITNDRDYGKALGLALVDVYRNFTVTLFKSVPLHNELNQMDLILFDESVDLKTCGKNILLTEKQSQVYRDYDEHIYKIYKYSNVRTLAGELLFIYTNLTGRKAVPVRNSNAKIVVFGAVEGGAGCTSAAISFAREMSRFHEKKVIYITLEEMESTMEYAEKGAAAKSVSEYLYYLFNSDDDQHFPFIESYTITDRHGVETFMPSPGRNIINSLNKDEMQFFISAVLDTGSYDIIVIDVSTSLGKPAMACYEMANNICLIAKEDGSLYKEERLIEYFVFTKGEKILERMGKVLNYCRKTAHNETEEILRTVCRLPYDPDSFNVHEGIREIKMDGDYGSQINKLTTSVVKNIIF